MIVAMAIDLPISSLLGKAVGAAAGPFLQRLRFALVKRGLLQDQEAAGRVAQLPGLHNKHHSVLTSIDEIPSDFTYAALRRGLDTPTFRALAREQIAIMLLDASGIHQQRVRQALAALLESIATGPSAPLSRIRNVDEEADYRYQQYVRIFVAFFEDVCSVTAAEIAQSVPSSKDRFDWGQSILALATVEQIERHVALLSATSNDEERHAAWLEMYLRQFRREHARIRLPDISTRRLVHYTRLYVRPSFAVLRGERKLGLRSFAEILDEIDRTVILGDPGAGKSTATEVISMTLSQDSRIVFLLRMREVRFAASGFNVIAEIEDVLATRYQLEVPPGLVEKLLRNGEALVIFDALDEVATEQQRRHGVQVIEAVSAAFPLSRILVTARTIGYSAVRLDPDVFNEYGLEPFQADQVRQYARNWFTLAGGISGKRLDDTVESFIGQSASISDLRSNPLMLTFICILYRGHNDIPRRRPQIYEKCIELLLRDWDAQRGIMTADTWEVDVYQIVLTEIAYIMYDNPENKNGMREDELIETAARNLEREAVADRREASRLARDMVDLCRNRGWIFTDRGPDESGEDVFAFTHTSLQEYFAAQHLVRTYDSVSALSEKLLNYMLAGRGEVLIQICVNLLSQQRQSGGSKLLESLAERVYALPNKNAVSLMEFLVSATDVVMINRSSLRVMVDRIADLLLMGEVYWIPRLLLAHDFRHQSAIMELLAESLRRPPVIEGNVARMAQHNPWIVDFCIQQRVFPVSGICDMVYAGHLGSTIDSFFCGALYNVTGIPPVSSAAWVISSILHPEKPAARTAAIETLREIHALVGDPGFSSNSCQANARISAEPLSSLPELARDSSLAFVRCLPFGNPAVGGLLFMVLAIAEIMLDRIPPVEWRDLGVTGQILEAREYGSVDLLPAASRTALDKVTYSFLRDWALSRRSLMVERHNTVVSFGDAG